MTACRAHLSYSKGVAMAHPTDPNTESLSAFCTRNTDPVSENPPLLSDIPDQSALLAEPLAPSFGSQAT